MGGGERHLLDLANGLAARGHDVHVALTPRSPLAKRLTGIPKENIVSLPLRNALDAASALDPLSSQGIVKAMRFGMAAGHAIAENAAGNDGALRAYAEEVERSFVRYLSVRQRYYRQESRWPQAAFWSRRH